MRLLQNQPTKDDTLFRMAKTKIIRIPNVRENIKKWNESYIDDENIKLSRHAEKQFGIF